MIHVELSPADAGSNVRTSVPKNHVSPLTGQSFTALLSDALAETLSKFGIDPNTIKLTVQDQPSQSYVTSHTSATTTAAADPGSAIATQHWYAGDAADDAYWSTQPAAVQQLREIDDVDQRRQLGEQLANAGYAIDVPIMIWGWDAGKVMQARQSYGYTWVPSALQPQVSATPGIAGAGVVPYDPKHPPVGSIQV